MLLRLNRAHHNLGEEHNLRMSCLGCLATVVTKDKEQVTNYAETTEEL